MKKPEEIGIENKRIITSPLVDESMRKIKREWDLEPVPWIVRETLEWLEQETLKAEREENNKKTYEPKKRYLEFIDISNPKNKTKLFDVWNKVISQKIGQIRWDTGWRCYVFDDGDLKMAEGCEFEMFEKLKELRENRDKAFKGDR